MTSTTRSTVVRPAILVVLALLLGVLAGLLYTSASREPAGIQSSYDFDVTDLPQLLGYADAAYVAQVTSRLHIDEDRATSTYSVDIVDVLMGDVSETAHVTQLGIEDVAELRDENQHLLRPGGRFLIVVSVEEDGGHTVVAGPRSVERLTGQLNADLRHLYAHPHRRNLLPVPHDGCACTVLDRERM